MRRFYLQKKNFIKIDDLTITHINNQYLLDEYSTLINQLINSFNLEYKWDDMFDINDVKKRIEQSNDLFLLHYGNNAIGYVFFKEIDDTTCFGYNLYITKLVNRPKNVSEWFYSETCERMFLKYNKIECEIENWNELVIKMVTKLGYDEII